MKITILFFAIMFVFSISSCYRVQPYPVQITVWDDNPIQSTDINLNVWIEDGRDTIHLKPRDPGLYIGVAWNNTITIHVESDYSVSPKDAHAKNDSIKEFVLVHLNK